VPAVLPFSVRWQLRWTRWANSEHPAHRRGSCGRERVEHHRSSLAGRDRVDGVRLLQRRDDVRIFERAADQSSGIDAIDGGTYDGVEILAEPRVEL
jgi:hypothetical protein